MSRDSDSGDEKHLCKDTLRKPYRVPKIIEEEIFERDALIAACKQAFVCGLPSKTPS